MTGLLHSLRVSISMTSGALTLKAGNVLACVLRKFEELFAVVVGKEAYSDGTFYENRNN